MKLSDLDIIKTIGNFQTGTGTFSRVTLARINKKPTLYALKMISKETLFKLKQIENAKHEKRVLQIFNSPFIIKIFSYFQDPSCLYLLLEYVPGGELFSRIRFWNRFPNDIALFYSTQIVLAIDHIHSQGYMYRDLKPENLLIDSKGNLKIADFGFCKATREKSYTVCGTPEYLAPEIIKSEGHGKAVDWWAFGVLLYEMLVGYPPFFGDSPYNTYRLVVRGKFFIPEYLNYEAKRLIELLLVGLPERRLGFGGCDEIKKDKWFEGVDFELVFRKEIPTPWTPVLRNDLDTRCFDDYPDELNFCEPVSQRVNELFSDF